MLIVVGALLLAWIATIIKRNRDKLTYLRNKVAQMEEIVYQIKVEHGKANERQAEETQEEDIHPKG